MCKYNVSTWKTLVNEKFHRCDARAKTWHLSEQNRAKNRITTLVLFLAFYVYSYQQIGSFEEGMKKGRRKINPKGLQCTTKSNRIFADVSWLNEPEPERILDASVHKYCFSWHASLRTRKTHRVHEHQTPSGHTLTCHCLNLISSSLTPNLKKFPWGVLGILHS